MLHCQQEHAAMFAMFLPFKLSMAGEQQDAGIEALQVLLRV